MARSSRTASLLNDPPSPVEGFVTAEVAYFLLVEGFGGAESSRNPARTLWRTASTAPIRLKYSAVPYVYILRCSDDSYYVGSTRDIDARLEQHNSGRGSRYTSTRTPVELMFFEEFDDVGEAYAMEKRIQGWSRKKREALISGDFKSLKSASERGTRYRESE